MDTLPIGTQVYLRMNTGHYYEMTSFKLNYRQEFYTQINGEMNMQGRSISAKAELLGYPAMKEFFGGDENHITISSYGLKWKGVACADTVSMDIEGSAFIKTRIKIYNLKKYDGALATFDNEVDTRDRNLII